MTANDDTKRPEPTREFTWSLCRASERAYVLRSGHAAIGSLRSLPGLGIVAAHGPQGYRWLLETVSRNEVIVRIPGDPIPFAHLAVKHRCSILMTREGLCFDFRPKNLLATRWMIEDQEKHLRVDFHGPGLLSQIVIHATARVDPTGLALLPLALVMGGYLMAQMIDEMTLMVSAAAMQG